MNANKGGTLMNRKSISIKMLILVFGLAFVGLFFARVDQDHQSTFIRPSTNTAFSTLTESAPTNNPTEALAILLTEGATEGIVASARIAAHQATMVEGARRGYVTDEPLPTPAEIPQPIPTGLYEGGLPAGFGGKGVLNVLDTYIDGDFYEVSAGSAENDPSQGVVWVRCIPKLLEDVGRLTSTYHNLPPNSGAVRILRVNENRLVLESVTTKQIYYFDIPGRQFVDSLTEIVPTITKIPLMTPTEVIPTSVLNPYPSPVP
jgi:hypothetical protein